MIEFSLESSKNTEETESQILSRWIRSRRFTGNLVIALLATKKYLTKNQIFRAVAGYEGSQEATDRMFERDKEELRSLGIQIEMKGIDPLFDDEIGYRIIPDRYRFDLGPLTKQEITLLALASQAWKESASIRRF